MLVAVFCCSSDLANPKGNLKTAGFTVEERESFSTLLEENKFVDSFRHLYPDKTAAYSYWSYRSNARTNNKGWSVQWRLDQYIHILYCFASSVYNYTKLIFYY